MKLATAIAGASVFSIAAYVSASYILSPAVIDSGGGHSSSSTYQLDCSIGGPVLATTVSGQTSSAHYTLDVNAVSMLDAPVPPAPPAPPDDGDGDGGGCMPGAGAGLPLVGILACMLRGAVRRA
jgi:hypothetical protein